MELKPSKGWKNPPCTTLLPCLSQSCTLENAAMVYIEDQRSCSICYCIEQSSNSDDQQAMIITVERERWHLGSRYQLTMPQTRPWRSWGPNRFTRGTPYVFLTHYFNFACLVLETELYKIIHLHAVLSPAQKQACSFEIFLKLLGKTDGEMKGKKGMPSLTALKEFRLCHRSYS